MSESYDVGTRAWQPDTTEGWVASEVVKKTVNGNKVELVFELQNGEVGTRSPNKGASSLRGHG
jgi:myosin V